MTPRPERDDFVRARIPGATTGPVLDPIAGQESHMIVQTTAADAIVHIPRGTDVLAAGSRDRLPAAVDGQRRRGDGTGRRRPRRHGPVAAGRERAELAATAAQASSTSTVVQGMNPRVISETR